MVPATTLQVFRHLQASGPRVSLNYVGIVSEAVDRDLELIVVGFPYRAPSTFATQTLRGAFASRSLIGVEGLSVRFGLTTPAASEGRDRPDHDRADARASHRGRRFDEGWDDRRLPDRADRGDHHPRHRRSLGRRLSGRVGVRGCRGCDRRTCRAGPCLEKAEFEAEAARLVDAANAEGITLRLLGALAFATRCPEHAYLQDQLGRVYTDIDFGGYGKQVCQIQQCSRERKRMLKTAPVDVDSRKHVARLGASADGSCTSTCF